MIAVAANWYRFLLTGYGKDEMTRILDDVRVLSLEQYAAGPYATLQLAELGADIIKVEQWPGGDVGRHVPPFRSGDDSLIFHALNRSKRSVCLDLSAPWGRTVFEDLARVSDAVFSNLRGDVPDRLGITYSHLASINSAIVRCSLTGYGMTGPRASQPGFDYMVQGIAGWMTITGEPEGPPSKTGLSAVDFSTVYAAALGVMAGIHAARRDGVGCDCDVSLLDTAMSMLNYLVTWTATRGYEPERVSHSGHPTLVPFQSFRTSDGWIVAGGSKEKFWDRMAKALGRVDLLADERFGTLDSRLAHKDELIRELDASFAQHTTEHWLSALEEAGVPCAPVNSVAEALQDPQVVARDMVFELNDPKMGRVTHVATPLRLGPDPQVRANPPALGAVALSVLSELLGYSPKHIRRLAAVGRRRWPWPMRSRLMIAQPDDEIRVRCQPISVGHL